MSRCTLPCPNRADRGIREVFSIVDRFKLIGCVYVFLTQSGRILMLRRFQTGYEDGNYSVPAGHLDGGESVTMAAIREAREECGVSIAPEDLQPVGVMHRRAGDGRVDFFFATTHWNGDVTNNEPHKCDDLSWHALDDLPENTIPYIRQAISNYKQGVWFSEFGWRDER